MTIVKRGPPQKIGKGKGITIRKMVRVTKSVKDPSGNLHEVKHRHRERGGEYTYIVVCGYPFISRRLRWSDDAPTCLHCLAGACQAEDW